MIELLFLTCPLAGIMFLINREITQMLKIKKQNRTKLFI